ncbi:MAG: hypothetical protein AVDCRST_MAG88-2296, partial [uncultured Thermomicrobiales bacterium]
CKERSSASTPTAASVSSLRTVGSRTCSSMRMWSRGGSSTSCARGNGSSSRRVPIRAMRVARAPTVSGQSRS